MNNIGDEMEETDTVDWIEVTNYGDEQQSTEIQIEIQMVNQSSETNKTNESEETSNHPSSSDHVIFEIQQSPPGPASSYQTPPIIMSDSVNPYSPTSSIPSTIQLAGNFHFKAKFTPFSYKNWDFSERLNKLYTDMNKWVQIKFSFGRYPTDGLYIRALPIYGDAADLKTSVKRCPNHARADDPTNSGFAFLDHLIRFDSPRAMYCEDLESGRLSVVAPLGTIQAGASSIPMLMKFMCLGSDIGGINRRPLRVIFTLEDEQTNVLGRQVIDVRICCCPKRDKTNDEDRFEKSRVQKEDICLDDQILLVPVHKDDFKKLNEFAEAAWICREPNNKEEIQETRRTHLRKVILHFLFLL
jgi:hypothetical protein